MGGCFSFNRSNVQIIDYTRKGKQFGYLKPNGTITYTIDRTYGVSEIEINFDGWYNASFWLWQKSTKTRSNFLNLQRTPLPSLTFSTSSLDSGFDTVF